jgi:hypothetical protein
MTAAAQQPIAARSIKEVKGTGRCEKIDLADFSRFLF